MPVIEVKVITSRQTKYKLMLFQNIDVNELTVLRFYHQKLKVYNYKAGYHLKYALAKQTLTRSSYLYMKVRRYVNVADLVRQLESLAAERITDTTFWR